MNDISLETVLGVVRPELTPGHVARMKQLIRLTDAGLFVSWSFLNSNENKIRRLRRDIEIHLQKRVELFGVTSLVTLDIGERAEMAALVLLVNAGYQILRSQPETTLQVRQGNTEFGVTNRPDFEVSKGADRFIVEVKAGSKSVNQAAFRRQLLEARWAWPRHRLLVVTGGVIEEIHF